MKIEVVTLFPRMIAAALEFGIVGRAIARGLMSVATEDPRLHATDVHRTVDDRPYGGGPGMVMKPEPLLAAIRAAHARLPPGSPRVYLSAQGHPFGQAQARELAALPGLLLLAGRYEGVDERVVELGIDRELSLGDYVLSGGELPALVIIDAVARLLPGALGDERSSAEDSFAQACSRGRITRGRKCSRAGACRRCCSRVTTPTSAAGGWRRRWPAPWSAGPTCWRARSSRPRRGAHWMSSEPAPVVMLAQGRARAAASQDRGD